MKPVLNRVSAALVACAALGMAASCGDDGASGEGGEGAEGGTGAGGLGGFSPGSGVTGGLLGSTGATGGMGQATSCEPSPDDQGCVGEAYEGEGMPLDIYVMFDVSCSMSCSVSRSGCCKDNDPEPLAEWRIEPVRQAMTAFLRDPASAGISVGLGFFGDHALNQNTDPVVCSVESHEDAAVEIAPLPGSASALISALEAAEPQGGTPTHLAIDGACSHIQSWTAANPGRKVVMLLVTDGVPEHSCRATIARAVSAAEGCFAAGEGPEIYVLGVVANNNNSLDQLHAIAEAGGTERAYLTTVEDVSGSMLAALNAIRADAQIPCDLRIPAPPSGAELDPGYVNLGICDAAGVLQTTPYVQEQTNCGNGPGWYYDDPSSPEVIHLCEATCETVSTPGARLYYTIGCATTIIR